MEKKKKKVLPVGKYGLCATCSYTTIVPGRLMKSKVACMNTNKPTIPTLPTIMCLEYEQDPETDPSLSDPPPKDD